MPNLRDGFPVEAAIFQVGVSYFALGSVGRACRAKNCRCHAVHLDQCGALLIVLALFGRAIARLRESRCRIFRRRRGSLPEIRISPFPSRT